MDRTNNIPSPSHLLKSFNIFFFIHTFQFSPLSVLNPSLYFLSLLLFYYFFFSVLYFITSSPISLLLFLPLFPTTFSTKLLNSLLFQFQHSLSLNLSLFFLLVSSRHFLLFFQPSSHFLPSFSSHIFTSSPFLRAFSLLSLHLLLVFSLHFTYFFLIFPHFSLALSTLYINLLLALSSLT